MISQELREQIFKDVGAIIAGAASVTGHKGEVVAAIAIAQLVILAAQEVIKAAETKDGALDEELKHQSEQPRISEEV